MARQRKISKEVDYEKGTVSFTIIATGDKLVCDTTKLPKDIQAKLIPLAVSHRIGDAAAGREDKEAFESMEKVWNGLVEGNFTIRTPAAPKLTKKDLKEKVSQLEGKEAAMAAALLKKLGISID